MNAPIPAVELLKKAGSDEPLRCALDMNTSSVSMLIGSEALKASNEHHLAL